MLQERWTTQYVVMLRVRWTTQYVYGLIYVNQLLLCKLGLYRCDLIYSDTANYYLNEWSLLKNGGAMPPFCKTGGGGIERELRPTSLNCIGTQKNLL